MAYMAGLPGLMLAYLEVKQPEMCAVFVDSIRCAEEIQHVRGLVQATLVPWTVVEILRDVEQATTVADRCNALHRAGLGAPVDPDDAFLECFGAAVVHPEVEVRATAVDVLARVGWVETRPLLQRVARDDRRKAIRSAARAVMQETEGLPDKPRPQPAPSPELFDADAAPGMYEVAMAELHRVRG